ncbi:MAG TPA: muconolactone Delta-isomerase family protein [Phycisphaerae bacterium]|nr:muconolactone Delta-isomerase family protein [Phycisphaerae bacterium]
MNVLIVHAHHEPKSFCSALSNQAAATLRTLGHSVTISDLYAMHFNPVSDRRNFTTVHDPNYLKQQLEERHASDHHGFAPDLETEIQKLEAADLLIFTFPLWWFGLPAILKGWVDRAFPMGRIYGDGKLYENGLGKARKRALAIFTTGGPPDAYSGFGANPAMDHTLAPIYHGIFWFNGFLPLDPFIAYSPVRISDDQRHAYLHQLDQRLQHIDSETPRTLPPLRDFPNFGKDSHKRFMVTVTRPNKPDATFLSLIPAEAQYLAELKRAGHLLTAHLPTPEATPWHAFLHFRAKDAAEVQSHLKGLPLAPYLTFEITELAQI